MPSSDSTNEDSGVDVFEIYMRGKKVDPNYSKDMAVAEFRRVYPEDSEQEVSEWLENRLEIKEVESKWSVFDWFVVGGRMLDRYDDEDAVKDFMEAHPDANEADVRAELERKLIEHYGENYRSVF